MQRRNIVKQVFISSFFFFFFVLLLSLLVFFPMFGMRSWRMHVMWAVCYPWINLDKLHRRAIWIVTCLICQRSGVHVWAPPDSFTFWKIKSKKKNNSHVNMATLWLQAAPSLAGCSPNKASRERAARAANHLWSKELRTQRRWNKLNIAQNTASLLLEYPLCACWVLLQSRWAALRLGLLSDLHNSSHPIRRSHGAELIWLNPGGSYRHSGCKQAR